MSKKPNFYFNLFLFCPVAKILKSELDEVSTQGPDQYGIFVLMLILGSNKIPKSPPHTHTIYNIDRFVMVAGYLTF